MNIRPMIAYLLAFVSLTCAPGPTPNERFVSLADNFMETFISMNPEYATGLGDHRYDGRLNDYSLEGVRKDKEFSRAYLDSLKMIDVAGLDSVNRIDYKIMKFKLESTDFYADTLKEYEWNPMNYNIGNAVYGLIAREFAPLAERMKSVESRLKQIPEVIAAAKSNLKNPPKIYTETAILQNGGNIGMVRDELTMFLDQVPEMKAEFAPVQEAAVKALEDYGTWLKDDLLPRSDGDARIGDMKFRRKLYFSLESDLTKEEIARIGREDLGRTQDTMYATALPLFRKYFPAITAEAKLEDRKYVIKAVLDKLAKDHPTNETIVDMAKADLAACTDFVREHDLVTVPDDPVRIIVMPEYQRGVAVAYCDAAGPLEKNGETFFSISPTPADWTKERVESFFREYNNYMLNDLTIHEAMPGHYLQLAHANRFKAPTKVRAIFASGTFVEGWATYAEQLMAEEGFGGPEVRMQQLKMRLRLIINALIDQGIHTAGMTEKEAMDMMMNDGFQEEGEAAGKWRRANLSSTQLSTYYVGNIEINNLRRAWEEKMGGRGSMKEMHDRMLSFGSPAARYVKELMGL